MDKNKRNKFQTLRMVSLTKYFVQFEVSMTSPKPMIYGTKVSTN